VTSQVKVAIPVQGDCVSQHFGHPEFFALLTVDREAKQIVAREDLTPPPHEPGVLPRWLADQQIKVVLVGGIGPRAVRMLESSGMNVITGVPAMPVEEALQLWLGDRLEAGGNDCHHGASPGEHHCGASGH